MKKSGLLKCLEQIKNDNELKEIEQGTMMVVIIQLLNYINDTDIENAVNEISM